ncbi:MAG: hypothetical protein ACRCV3_01955 [Desulfovibrionaceae bacterium]
MNKATLSRLTFALTKNTPGAHHKGKYNVSSTQGRKVTPRVVSAPMRTLVQNNTSSHTGVPFQKNLHSSSLLNQVQAEGITGMSSSSLPRRLTSSSTTQKSESMQNAKILSENQLPTTSVSLCKKYLTEMKNTLLDKKSDRTAGSLNKITSAALDSMQRSFGPDTPKDAILRSSDGMYTVKVSLYQVVSISKKSSNGRDFTIQSGSGGEFEVGYVSQNTGKLNGKGTRDGVPGKYHEGVFTSVTHKRVPLPIPQTSAQIEPLVQQPISRATDMVLIARNSPARVVEKNIPANAPIDTKTEESAYIFRTALMNSVSQSVFNPSTQQKATFSTFKGINNNTMSLHVIGTTLDDTEV